MIFPAPLSHQRKEWIRTFFLSAKEGLSISLKLLSLDLKSSFPSPKIYTIDRCLEWVCTLIVLIIPGFRTIKLKTASDYRTAWLAFIQKRPLVKGSRVTLVSLCACPIRGRDLLSGQWELTECTKRHLVTENLCTYKQRQLVSNSIFFYHFPGISSH